MIDRIITAISNDKDIANMEYGEVRLVLHEGEVIKYDIIKSVKPVHGVKRDD